MYHPVEHQVSRRRGALPAIGLSLALMVLLAACGTSTTAQSFPTATDIPATPGTAQLNGCPVQAAPATTRTAAVVAHGSGVTPQTGAQPVAVKVGQTFEIDLPATFRWALVLTDQKSILTAPAANGWFDPGGMGCVWQFTATKAGSATLTFGGGQVCASASMCPDLTIGQSFSVTAS